jgi:hypothetical protein
VTCYKCNRKVTTKDEIIFIAGLPEMNPLLMLFLVLCLAHVVAGFWPSRRG